MAAVERSVLSRGHRVRYLTQGAGPAIVLLHGFSQSSDSWFDAGVAESLADRFCVVAIDRLGHGGSDAPAEPLEYDELGILDDIATVLAAESIESATLWGFSLGAKSAMAFAIRSQDRVRSLIQGSAPPLDAAKLERFFNTVDAVLERHGRTALYASLGATDHELIEGLVSNNDVHALRCALAGSLRDVPDPRSVGVPWLYYYGGAEAPGPAPSDLEIVGEHADEIHVIDDAGHLECFDRSVSDALAFVVPFLNGHSNA